ncbi:MAG: hypothetical protein ABIH88_02650, partial [Patescibacteria group bacterium]
MIKIKKKIFSKTKSLYFFIPPVLTAIFPILSFYLTNISELSLKFIGRPIFYSIIAAVTGTLLLSALTRNKNKASLIVSLVLLIFFSYGYLSRSLNDKLFIQLPNNIVLGPDKILLPIIFGLFI